MKIPKATFRSAFPDPAPGDGMNAARWGFSRVVRTSPGFALVITLSLCVLMTLLAIGLLSLSSISLRGGSRGEYAAQAKANARLALMLAIGQLQKQAGPDTRVTAKADILDDRNPPVAGAWKSWEGTDHDSQGRPVSPGNYESKKRDRFLAWLVSTGGDELPDTGEGNGKVTLVGPGSVGEGPNRDALQIHLEPTEIRDSSGDGAVAWWVSGENQKARVPKPYRPEEDNPARWAVMAKSHSPVDPAPFRMEGLFDDASPAGKAVTHLSSDFVGEEDQMKISREFFHDLSVSSVGLLTNTATGGWRKDLSLLTENWSTVPNSNLPFFRGTPLKDIMFTKPTSSNPCSARSMIYPWSSYRGTTEIPIYRHGAVSSWENLKDYATAYKRIAASPSGANRIATSAVAIEDTGNTFNFLHKVRILPVVARVQWVFSHTAAAAASPAGNVEPRLLVTPVITMWNPYSVQISTSSSLRFTIPKPLPVALRYTVNGTATPTYTSLTTGGINNQPAMSTAGTLQYEISSTFVLKPGETRVFSPQSTTPVAATISLPLAQGYRAKGGHFFQVMGVGGKPMSVGASSMVKADAKFDTTYTDISQGVGIYMDMLAGGTQRLLAYRMTYTPAMANEIYKPLTDLSEVSLSNAINNPVPFLSTVFGARMASKTHIPAKGFIQSSPLVNYTAMGSKDQVETTIARHYGGTYHPVNSPFDYSFIKLTPNDSNLPNASDTSGRGYIVTGFNKADGLSRCVIAEIPTRPLQSLCELQNWDLRYENPIPPYAFNLIGNSDASPLLPSDAVVNSADAGLGVNLQHDDSYCANHILFDDWFFSSIAPDPNTFGTSGRNMQRTYTDFLSGTAPLGNRAYLPIPEDAGMAREPSNATKLYNDNVRATHAWKTIASRLEVEGMFNVNSTSVTAWRALLGHARNLRVPYIQESGSSWSVDLSNEADHPVSRFTMAGDVEAKSQGSSGSFPEAAEFAGYRVLDDEVIDALAEEVVKQVRARGPFLSLSEFVNRQLSSGDLALAGAVQAALNQIAKRSATNPYSAIEALSNNASAVPPRAAEAEYKFPAAAEGESAYGLPGWTRQADVLRPIAPILSARDDTFTIRAHGDARDKEGKIVSRATCEAVVRRTRLYVDPREAADLANPVTRPVNKAFGRHFEIVSFRWLSPSEI